MFYQVEVPGKHAARMWSFLWIVVVSEESRGLLFTPSPYRCPD